MIDMREGELDSTSFDMNNGTDPDGNPVTICSFPCTCTGTGSVAVDCPDGWEDQNNAMPCDESDTFDTTIKLGVLLPPLSLECEDKRGGAEIACQEKCDQKWPDGAPIMVGPSGNGGSPYPSQGTCEPVNCCGNSVIEADETCDDGNWDDEDGCDSSCQMSTVAVCGDLLCDPGEDETSCPQDCSPATSSCGDFICDVGEDETICPEDCSTTNPH